MLRVFALLGLVMFGLVATPQPSQAYWVRGPYGLVWVRPYYRPVIVRRRVVVVPPPPVVRPAPVVVAPYPYYRPY